MDDVVHVLLCVCNILHTSDEQVWRARAQRHNRFPNFNGHSADLPFILQSAGLESNEDDEDIHQHA